MIVDNDGDLIVFWSELDEGYGFRFNGQDVVIPDSGYLGHCSIFRQRYSYRERRYLPIISIFEFIEGEVVEIDIEIPLAEGSSLRCLNKIGERYLLVVDICGYTLYQLAELNPSITSLYPIRNLCMTMIAEAPTQITNNGFILRRSGIQVSFNHDSTNIKYF